MFPHFKPGRLRQQTDGESRVSWVHPGDKMQSAEDFTLERATLYPQLAARPPSFPRTPKKPWPVGAAACQRFAYAGRVLSELDGNFTLKVGQKLHCFSWGGGEFFVFFLLISPFPTGFGKKLISHHGANRIVARTANVKEVSQKDTLEKFKTFLACWN